MVDRRTYIGGGDAAAVAGVGRWGSPYSVWAYKTGLSDEGEVSERMSWGLLLERPVAEEWARRNGVTNLRKASFRRHPTIPYIGGHPDFYGIHPADGGIVIETKLSDRPSEWEGDEIPLQYFLQVQHYMLVTGGEVAYLVVLLRGNELRSFRIPADPEVQSGLLETYAEFWSHVVLGTPPEADGHEATAEAIKRRFPRGEDSEMVADLPAQRMIEDLLATRRELQEVEGREAGIANRIKERMGSISRLLAPGATVTWKNNKDSERTDWQSVAKAYRSVIQDVARDERLLVHSALHANGHPESIESVPAALDVIESIHTNTIPGARVFRVTTKSEE